MSIIREALQEAQQSEQIPLEELRKTEVPSNSGGTEFGLMPSLAEDIRALRENMELLSGQNKIKVIGIASSAANEGTSTVATFLAVSIGNGSNGSKRNGSAGTKKLNSPESNTAEIQDQSTTSRLRLSDNTDPSETYPGR